MRNQGVFPGIVLIGVGTYFLLRQFQFPFLQQVFTWPTLLILVGIAFLAQGYSEDRKSIFPGVILVGLGIHFHARTIFSFWPYHWAMYPLIISIAFFLQYQKTKHGLVPGLILFTISILGLFYDGVIGWMSWIGKVVHWMESFWPIVLILIGVYLLFKRR